MKRLKSVNIWQSYKLRHPICKQRPQKRLNVRACNDPVTQENLQKKMADLSQNSTDDSMSNATDCQSLTDEW